MIASNRKESSCWDSPACSGSFRRYYLHSLEAELTQGIGRLRHNVRGEVEADAPPHHCDRRRRAAASGELIHFEEILEAKNKEAIDTLKDAEKLDELAGPRKTG